MKRYVIPTLIFMLCGCQSEKPQQASYVRWSYPVALSKEAPEELNKLAVDLGESLGNRVPLRATSNIVCCFWIELDQWKPNPMEAGYIVTIHPGGAVVRATDLEQMRSAIDAIKRVLKVEHGEVMLPLGVLTNYPVVK